MPQAGCSSQKTPNSGVGLPVLPVRIIAPLMHAVQHVDKFSLAPDAMMQQGRGVQPRTTESFLIEK